MSDSVFEKHLVNNCAPTLAHLKTANLFSLKYDSEARLNSDIKKWSAVLSPKGISIYLIRKSEGMALIYVCRLSRLQQDLHGCGVESFMKALGYNCLNPEYCINKLSQKLSGNPEFPHEIGIFLGYPLCDVTGFIDNKGKNCLCCGCWKVYSNKSEAERKFEQFNKCRNIYCRLWEQGRSVLQLTVNQRNEKGYLAG